MSGDDKNGLTRRDLFTIGGAAAGALITGGAVLGGSPAEAAEQPLPQVPRRVLGKTGKDVPILLMGGSMGFDLKFDPRLAEAVRFGVNYVDAADCYAGGNSETGLAAYFAKANNRDKVWVTSKSDKHEAKGFEQTVLQSLERIKTDWIDLYYLHDLSDPDYLNDELAILVMRLKKAKKIRHFGFSCHGNNVPELLHKAAKTPWVESIMFRFNYRSYGNKELNDAINAAHKAGIGLIAMKTQGSEAGIRDAWKKFEQTGKWNKHQAVLKAVWEDERITAAVSHMDTFDKLKQNIAAATDQTKLTVGEWDALERYAQATRPYACDGCDRICGAHAPGVQIADTLRYLMYHDSYGQAAEARYLFSQLPVQARQITGVDFSSAAAACPHRVDIAGLMRRAGTVLA
ncbi:MAG: aldo/keto reductase [Acidobacteria bacterium]|nr:aldo/keto reductase [Acidobacteriota bacterium]